MRIRAGGVKQRVATENRDKRKYGKMRRYREITNNTPRPIDCRDEKRDGEGDAVKRYQEMTNSTPSRLESRDKRRYRDGNEKKRYRRMTNNASN